MKKIFVLFAFMFVSSFIYAASVTIYNDNFALVRDTKDVDVKVGKQTIEVDDVSAKIDPTSVLPKFLSDSNNITILEQNYDFDLVNSNKLLQKYIGKDITVERYLPNSQKEKISGKLLSVQGGTIIKTNNDKIVINPSGEISLPKMPDGLMLKPTLSWLINSKVAGKKKLELTYKTTGFSWVADYVAVLNKDDKNIDLNAWVTINNTSGATYKDAKLKLVAGDVNTVKEPRAARSLMMAKNAVMEEAAYDTAAGFQEQAFFEYHIYKLQRKADLKDNEKKQIEFTAAQNIPVEKKYTYQSSKNNKVEISLKFKNNKASNLGIPLPKGKVRVFKSDGDSIEFVGEDMIDHTPENKDMRLTLGNAFDVTAEKKMTNSSRNNSAKQSEETYEIVLKNAKDETVKVDVIETFYGWSNWKIVSNSHKFEKKDSNTIAFEVDVPAKSETKVTYKVKYSW
ncbi:DUF4139 domain-containing protein [Candidatus Ruminimicrobiellum ovillum]|uniref:DUF4139 domain-containing protein n=1 Tax=Candidatus Ruminimicrobiellum ovillum TaxID=1947927 RepID=UPI003559C5EF